MITRGSCLQRENSWPRPFPGPHNEQNEPTPLKLLNTLCRLLSIPTHVARICFLPYCVSPGHGGSTAKERSGGGQSYIEEEATPRQPQTRSFRVCPLFCCSPPPIQVMVVETRKSPSKQGDGGDNTGASVGEKPEAQAMTQPKPKDSTNDDGESAASTNQPSTGAVEGASSGEGLGDAQAVVEGVDGVDDQRFTFTPKGSSKAVTVKVPKGKVGWKIDR